MNESFDEHRFNALLTLAGPENGLELATRLDEDLTGVAAALTAIGLRPDPPLLRAQSHVLLAIAGTIGANQLYLLAERLNRQARRGEVGAISDLLADIRLLLDLLIQRVRSVRSNLSVRP